MNKESKRLEGRLIAMLDVLGLSTKLSDMDSLEESINRYSNLIREAREKNFNAQTLQGSPDETASNFEIGEFVFDTVVLVSPPITPESASKFVLAVIDIMKSFYKAEMPLRGAIGIGNYCFDGESNVFLSDIFKRLSYEEQNQRWSGCSLLPEVEDLIIDNVVGKAPDIHNQIKSNVFVKYALPVKCSDKTNQGNILKRIYMLLRSLIIIRSRGRPISDRWCLNWVYMLSPSEVMRGLSYMSADPDKHYNTSEFVEWINALKDDAIQLDASFIPAVKMKCIRTRGSANLQFVDGDGEGVLPGRKDFTISFFEKSGA